MWTECTRAKTVTVVPWPTGNTMVGGWLQRPYLVWTEQSNLLPSKGVVIWESTKTPVHEFARQKMTPSSPTSLERAIVMPPGTGAAAANLPALGGSVMATRPARANATKIAAAQPEPTRHPTAKPERIAARAHGPPDQTRPPPPRETDDHRTEVRTKAHRLGEGGRPYPRRLFGATTVTRSPGGV